MSVVGHHPSHTSLLDVVTDPGSDGQRLDAIVVPTSRTPAYLKHAVDLAAALDTRLIALCSGYARPFKIISEYSGKLPGLIAAELRPSGGLPGCRTSDLISGPPFSRRTDTSHKRNAGLAIARLAGWDRIVFLDDDITVPRPADLLAAAGLTDRYDVVGLGNDGYPDNSVVCHAYRAVGAKQDSFIGGGAMAVPTSRVTSFFPDVYNEDWFFLLDDEDGRLGKVAVTGTVRQKAFDPFVNPMRARTEELGDTLAEGVYALVDGGLSVRDANVDFWRAFIADRRRMINDILGRIPALAITGERRDAMAGALRAALGRQMRITPEFCVDFLARWRQDRQTWRRFLTRLADQRADTVTEACRRLGITVYQK